MELAENANEMSMYNCDEFQPNQQFTKVLSSNNNKLQSPVLDYYYTLNTDLHLQPSNPTNEHSIGWDVTFEQNGQPKVAASFDNETPRIEYSKVPMYSKMSYYHTSKQQGQEEMMSMQEDLKRLNKYSTTITSTNRFDSINPVCVESENSNPTYGNYELSGSYSAEYKPNVQQQQGNIQTESINSVQAHQWRQHREKLPITPLDATFYTEWQINRPQVVNTAEIQKRKMLVFQPKADEQLNSVNQRNTSSTPEQLKKPKKNPKQKQQQQQQPSNSQEQQHQPCNSQEQQQQHEQQLHQAQNFYRLHQMQQQQNYLRSPTPDSLSSSRQFPHSPVSLNSSTASPHHLKPQIFPHIQSALSQQIQMQPTLQPNNDNASYNSMLPQQQQQLMLQMLQQQQLQPRLHHHYQSIVNPNFFEKWQNLNQQKYQEALQENMLRHKDAHSSRQHSRKRKRQRCPRQIGDDKENASVNLFEPLLVTDESVAVQRKNVPEKWNDDLVPTPNSEGSVIVNLSDVKTLSSNDENIVKNDAELKSEQQSTLVQSGLWQNNFGMLQDWLQTQQQDVNQKESDVVQYGNAE